MMDEFTHTSESKHYSFNNTNNDSKIKDLPSEPYILCSTKCYINENITSNKIFEILKDIFSKELISGYYNPENSYFECFKYEHTMYKHVNFRIFLYIDRKNKNKIIIEYQRLYDNNRVYAMQIWENIKDVLYKGKIISDKPNKICNLYSVLPCPSDSLCSDIKAMTNDEIEKNNLFREKTLMNSIEADIIECKDDTELKEYIRNINISMDLKISTQLFQQKKYLKLLLLMAKYNSFCLYILTNITYKFNMSEYYDEIYDIICENIKDINSKEKPLYYCIKMRFISELCILLHSKKFKPKNSLLKENINKIKNMEFYDYNIKNGINVF